MFLLLCTEKHSVQTVRRCDMYPYCMWAHGRTNGARGQNCILICERHCRATLCIALTSRVQSTGMHACNCLVAACRSAVYRSHALCSWPADDLLLTISASTQSEVYNAFRRFISL